MKQKRVRKRERKIENKRSFNFNYLFPIKGLAYFNNIHNLHFFLYQTNQKI